MTRKMGCGKEDLMKKKRVRNFFLSDANSVVTKYGEK